MLLRKKEKRKKKWISFPLVGRLKTQHIPKDIKKEIELNNRITSAANKIIYEQPLNISDSSAPPLATKLFSGKIEEQDWVALGKRKDDSVKIIYKFILKFLIVMACIKAKSVVLFNSFISDSPT